MGPDAANLAGAIGKSLEVERSPSKSQRASEIAQDATASAFNSVIQPIKMDNADALRRARLLQERERRRREFERRLSSKSDSDEQSDGEPGLDVMV